MLNFYDFILNLLVFVFGLRSIMDQFINKAFLQNYDDSMAFNVLIRSIFSSVPRGC